MAAQNKDQKLCDLASISRCIKDGRVVFSESLELIERPSRINRLPYMHVQIWLAAAYACSMGRA